LWGFSLYMAMGTIIDIDIWAGATSIHHNCHCHNSRSDGSRMRRRTMIFPNKTTFLER